MSSLEISRIDCGCVTDDEEAFDGDADDDRTGLPLSKSRSTKRVFFGTAVWVGDTDGVDGLSIAGSEGCRGAEEAYCGTGVAKPRIEMVFKDSKRRGSLSDGISRLFGQRTL